MYQESEINLKPLETVKEKISVNPPKKASFLSVVKSAAIVDIQINKRYPAQLIGGIVQVLLFVVFFGVFATAISFNSLQNFSNHDLFLFFLGGLMLVFFTDVALWVPLNSVTRDLYNGTLEAIYFTPASRYGYFLGYILGSTIVTGGILYLPIFFILAIVSGATLTNMFFILLVSVTTIVSLIAMGVLFALTAILWKNVSGLAGLLNVVMQFLTGAFIPVSSLPEGIQLISYLLPQTYGMDLVRYYSFNGSWATFFGPIMEWAVLFLFAIVYTGIAFILLRLVERRAKTKGLHLI